MKKLLLTSVSFLILPLTGFSQPEIDWIQTYDFDSIDMPRVLLEHPDGGVWVIGETGPSAIDHEPFMLHISANGTALDTILFELSPEYRTYCFAACEGSDNTVVLACTRRTTVRFYDLVVLKVNVDGDIVWSTAVEDTMLSTHGFTMQPSFDGGYIVGGEYLVVGEPISQKHAFAAKFSENGEQEWSFYDREDRYGTCKKIGVLPEGDFVLAGDKYINLEDDSYVYFLELSRRGDVLHADHLYFNEYFSISLSDFEFLPNGNLLGCGTVYPESPESNNTPWLFELDQDFQSLWSRLYTVDYPVGISEMKLLSSGRIILTGPGSVFGSDSTDLFILYLDSEGNEQWRYTHDLGDREAITDILEMNEEILLTGSFRINTDSLDVWNGFLLKLNPEHSGKKEDDSIVLPRAFRMLPSYPNPFNHSTNVPFELYKSGAVTVQVYDILGRMIKNDTFQHGPGRYTYVLDLKFAASGTYFLKMNALGVQQVQRIMLIK